MKLKIYSISLLLSFLVVLNHEMIPHHHGYGMEKNCGYDTHSEYHSHLDSDHHHNHDPENYNHNQSKEPEKDCDHSFPFHQHLSATNDFDCLRVEINKNISISRAFMVAINSFLSTVITPPPESDFTRYRNKPFQINSIFEPDANGLRAPPPIA